MDCTRFGISPTTSFCFSLFCVCIRKGRATWNRSPLLILRPSSYIVNGMGGNKENKYHIFPCKNTIFSSSINPFIYFFSNKHYQYYLSKYTGLLERVKFTWWNNITDSVGICFVFFLLNFLSLFSLIFVKIIIKYMIEIVISPMHEFMVDSTIHSWEFIQFFGINFFRVSFRHSPPLVT